MKVLVINSHPYGELFVNGECRIPVPPQDRMLVSTDYNGALRGHDPADFPTVAKCADIYDEEHVRKAVYELAAVARPDRIVTISEQLMLVAAELREEFGLPGQDVDSTLRFRDKMVMKRLLREADVAGIPRSVDADHDFAELPWQADRYVVKNRLGFGSRTVQIVATLDELNQARRELDADEPGVEVEEFVEGEMFHCDGLVHHGVPVFTSVSRYLSPPGGFRSVASRGSVTLAEGPLRQRIVDYHQKVVRHLGLADGVTHLEVFHTPDDRIMFCEIAARPGGGGICTIVRQAHGVDLISAALRAQSGFDPRPRTRPDGRLWGLIGYYPQPGLLPVPIDVGPLPEDLGVHRYFSGGVRPGPAESSTDYVHKFVVSAADAQQFDRSYADLSDVVAQHGWRTLA
jgi:biotin carboxylase